MDSKYIHYKVCDEMLVKGATSIYIHSFLFPVSKSLRKVTPQQQTKQKKKKYQSGQKKLMS